MLVVQLKYIREGSSILSISRSHVGGSSRTKKKLRYTSLIVCLNVTIRKSNLVY